MTMASEAAKTEWVAVLHGQNGTVKIAYRSPTLLAKGLAEQTSEGWIDYAGFLLAEWRLFGPEGE